MRKRIKVKENGPECWSIPPLRSEDHKYTRGHVMVLGGEILTGAGKLMALAAQRAGAGVVTIAATRSTWPIYAGALSSTITRPVSQQEWEKKLQDDRINVVLIGPGAEANARTKHALRSAAKAGKQLVLDATALTLIAEDASLRKLVMPSAKIITPHQGEYQRLAKALKLPSMVERTSQAEALAIALKALVVLKGSQTIISDGKHTLVTYPPAWLASAGTGDVLAGIIAALVGQGMTLFDAAAAGVWLHAQAAKQHGIGMIAEDVIASIPTVLRQLSV